MSNNEDVKAKLEDIKHYLYKEIHQLMQVGQGKFNVGKDNIIDNRFEKFKPSKHKRAYKKSKEYLKKRCYLR